MANRLDCIFLDLDGTILDGKLKHYNCYRDILIKDGGQPLDIDIYWNMKRSKIKRTITLEKSFYKKSYDDFYNQWIDNIETAFEHLFRSALGPKPSFHNH